MKETTLIFNNVKITIYENLTIYNHSKNQFIPFHISSNGYLEGRIGLKRVYLHRLIAKAFLSTFTESLSVNHIDGNKLNNNADNLEMLSLSDNTKHAHLTGLIKTKGIKNKISKLNDEIALLIFNSSETYNKISNQYNISIATISLIKNKLRWKHIHTDA